MNFREFVQLNETRHYAVSRDPEGNFKITGPYDRMPDESRGWPISIEKGQLILPTALEPFRDQIVSAYFHRSVFAPFHRHYPADVRGYESPYQSQEEEESDVIEPHVFGTKISPYRYDPTQPDTTPYKHSFQ